MLELLSNAVGGHAAVINAGRFTKIEWLLLKIRSDRESLKGVQFDVALGW